MPPKTKIAIACQGGGSHTAFTAGVLQKLLAEGIQDRYQIAGLTGTSGGAICATAAWYGLARSAEGAPEPPYQTLMDFWEANAAQSPLEKFYNASIQGYLQAAEAGAIPTFPPDPYQNQWIAEAAKQAFPRPEFLDFRALIEQHIDFEELRSLIAPDRPRLLMGAVDILTGEFKVFDSHHPEEIRIEALLASAAIPSIFRAVRIGESLYWDGLFSQNPPVTQLLDTERDRRPDELWVIMIDPLERREEPRNAKAISDRRDELAGNLSLQQELNFIETVNRWIAKGYFTKAKARLFKPIRIRRIKMSRELSSALPVRTKAERDPAFFRRLIRDGQDQAAAFMTELDTAPAT